jgi:hypothetical protein
VGQAPTDHELIGRTPIARALTGRAPIAREQTARAAITHTPIGNEPTDRELTGLEVIDHAPIDHAMTVHEPMTNGTVVRVQGRHPREVVDDDPSRRVVPTASWTRKGATAKPRESLRRSN